MCRSFLVSVFFSFRYIPRNRIYESLNLIVTGKGWTRQEVSTAAHYRHQSHNPSNTYSLTTLSKVAASYSPSHYLLISILALNNMKLLCLFNSLQVYGLLPLTRMQTLKGQGSNLSYSSITPQLLERFPACWKSSIHMCGINAGILNMSLLSVTSIILIWCSLFKGTLSWWVQERGDSQQREGP